MEYTFVGDPFTCLTLLFMKATVQEIAHMIGANIEGDGSRSIDNIAGLEQAGPSCLSFLANPKYEPFVYTTGAGAVLVSSDFEPKEAISTTLLRVPDPYLAFTSILEFVQSTMNRIEPGIHPTAVVDENATIGEDVYIGPYAVISAGAEVRDGAIIHPFAFLGTGVSVGEKSVIHAHVTIYQGCIIGANCIVHAATVIGADGFGFAPQEDGTFRKIPQLGIVELEDGVEVGANSCLDRATMGKTVIKKGAKLDNLVQVAHNVTVGESSVIAAQSGISGSTTLGKGVMVGGQVGFVGHLHIADGTKVDAQSGVNKSIKEPNQAFRGSPIQPFRQQLKSELFFRKLVDMESRIRELEAKLGEK